MKKKELSQQLHCSERTVDEFTAQGVLIAGEHFYRSGLKGGALVFCLERSRQALLQHTAARMAAAADVPVTYDEGHLNDLIAQVQRND